MCPARSFRGLSCHRCGHAGPPSGKYHVVRIWPILAIKSQIKGKRQDLRTIASNSQLQQAIKPMLLNGRGM
jgi:hypothetical protein